MIIDYDSIEKVKFKDYKLDNINNIKIFNQLNEFAKECFNRNKYFTLTGSFAMILNFNKIYRDIKDIDLYFKYKDFHLIYDIIEILNNLGFYCQNSLSTITHKEKRYASDVLENITDNFEIATNYIIDGTKKYIEKHDLINPFFDNQGVFHDPNGKNSVGFDQVEKFGQFFRIWFKNTLVNPLTYEAFVHFKNKIINGRIPAHFSYNEEKNVPFNDWWCSELIPIEFLNSKFEYKIELVKFHKNFTFKKNKEKCKFELHIEDFDYKLSSDEITTLFYNEHQFGITTYNRNYISKNRYNRQKDIDDLEFYSQYKCIH